MPRLNNLQELTLLRESVQRELHTREHTGTVITVGMGTCGIAAGARETLAALEHELSQREISATLLTVGCIGICAQEPLVEIRQAGISRVLYGNLTAERVPRLIDEHLQNGRAVKEWAVARMGKD